MTETPKPQSPEFKPAPSQLVESYNRPEPAFGWTAYAEQLNGRFAMLGFVFLILLEIFTRQDLLTWLGLR